mgnify:CR=1 FL=1
MGQRARNLKLSDAADSTTSSLARKKKKEKTKREEKIEIIKRPSLFQTIISRLCVLLIIENIFSF